MRTGIICKKISCYMHDSACRWLIIENTSIFQRSVKHYFNVPHKKVVES